MKVQIGNQTIEVPQGVEVKIIDEEMHKFKGGEYISYNGGVFHITGLTATGYSVKQIVPTTTEPKAEWIEFSFTREPELTKLPNFKEPKFKGGEYLSFDGGVFNITGLTERGYRVRQVRPTKSEPEDEWVEFGFFREKDLVELPDYEEIIEEWGDAHDPELRSKINDAWNKNREGFCPILCALYARDIDEITDHDAFRYEEWNDTPEYRNGLSTGCWAEYNIMALNHMQREWDFFAGNYLNHIADDCDLECILNFLHYPYLPIFKD